MSLDKAIKHGKEKRKPYKGSKAFDHTCRNHGGCPWCERNRTLDKNKEAAKDQVKEYKKSQRIKEQDE